MTKLSLLRRAASWIAEYEFWLLWVFGVPLILSSNLPQIVFYLALATIPIFWVARRIVTGALSVQTPLDLPLGLIILLGMVGMAVSIDVQLSAYTYAEWLGGIAVYYGIVNSATSTRLRWGVWLLLALGCTMGVLGMLGMTFTDKFLPVALYPFLPKLNVSFLNPRGFTPNIVAGAIAPVIPLALVWMSRQRGLQRAFIISVAILLIGVVLLTQSRGAFLGLMVAFVVLGVWRFPSLKWLMPLGVLIFLMVLVSIGPLPLGEWMLVSDSTGTVAGRWELWQRALFIFQDFPFTGIGLSTFQQVVPVIYPLFLNAPSAPLPHAHNYYLQMGVDFGIGGMIAYLGLVTAALAVGWRTVARAARGTSQWLVMGLLAGYLVFLIHSLLDAVAVSTKVSIVVWFLLGLLMASAARERDNT